MSFIHDIYEFKKSFRNFEKFALKFIHLKNAVELNIYIYIYNYKVQNFYFEKY